MNYVFNIDHCRRYKFPTHINDIVVDRADASTSEVFVVIVEPGRATPLHKHDDVEQIFHVVEGEGMLVIGADKREYSVKPTQVVKIPPKTLHAVQVKGNKPIRYVCIDCFCPDRKNDEPTWDDHVKTVCREQGYDYGKVISSNY